jgi:hypothetical protein
MTELLTRNYVRRGPRPNERQRIEDALRVFDHMMHNLRFDRGNELTTAEIRLPNKTNPNGFTIRLGNDGKPLVERFINLGWARRHGYVDAYNTSTGRKRQRRRA